MTGDGRVVRYVGGPWDGEVLELPEGEEPGEGAHVIVEGWADRAAYEPDPGGDPLVWRYRGPVPG